VSFTDRLNKFTKDLGGAALAAPRMVWDVATAPWNDNERYNGFVKTISSAAGDAIKSSVRPIGDVISGLNAANFEGIRRPIATTLLVNEQTNPIETGNVSDIAKFTDPDTWKKAYNASREISVGQAFSASKTATSAVPFLNPIADAAEKINKKSDESITIRPTDKNFDIFDPKQREEVFKNSMYGKVYSGSADLVAQLFGDVTLIGGKGLIAVKAGEKGVGLIRNSNDAINAIQDIRLAETGIANRFTKVINDFTANDSVYAINHPMVVSSNQPGLLAHLLGQSKTTEETSRILKASLGDPETLIDLADKRRDISDALMLARGELNAAQKHKILAATQVDGMLPLVNDNPVVLDEARANMTALASADRRFADMMEIGQAGGSLKRTTGSNPVQVFEDFIAKGRAAKFYDKTPSVGNVDIYQPTPFHRLYQKISWLENERPSGLVDLNDVDSHKEIVATLDRARALLPDVPEENLRGLLQGYIGSNTPEMRSRTLLNVEGRIFGAIAQKHNVDRDVAEKLYNSYKRARTSAIQSLKNNGFMVDLDESIIKVPIFESQTANHMPIMDFDLLDNLLKKHTSTLNLMRDVKDEVVNGLETVQDLFKAGALLRLGYTTRNGIDSQLRIMSTVGSMASLRHLGKGFENILRNTGKDLNRTVDRFAVTLGKQDSYLALQKSYSVLGKEITKHNDDIVKIEKKLVKDPEDIDVISELNIAKNVLAEKEALRKAYNDKLANLESKAPNKKFRVGETTFKFTTSDGKVWEGPDAFSGPLGDLWRNLSSSENSFRRLVDTNANLIGKTFTSKGIGAVAPDQSNYFVEWAQVLNRQFRNSVVVQKLASGQNKEDVINWLQRNPAGRDLRRRLAVTSDDSAEYVYRVNSFLNKYAFDPNLKQMLVDGTEITPNFLRNTFKDVESLPVVHGHVLEANIGNKGNILQNKIINPLFKMLGSLPEDAWARHPLFIDLYRKSYKQRVDIFTGLNPNRITPSELNVIQRAARQDAMRNVKKILFNVERKTNFANIMRLVSPFFSAQENAYKTWLGIAAAKPYIFNRAQMIWNAPNRAGLVTDQNGNEITGDKLTYDGTIWIEVPKGLQKLPGLSSLNQLGISKKSLDVVFGGDFNVPVGPYVAIPVSEIVKRKPTYEQALKWAIPYGTEDNALTALLPTWVKRQVTKTMAEDSPEYARTFQLIWTTEQHKAKSEGRPPVPASTIERMTKDYYNMRTVANLILPFAPKFNSPYRFWMDKWQEYRRVYGKEADAAFLHDYPEYFDFATSLSSNIGGVTPYVGTYENIEQNKELVAELKNIEPGLIGAVVNNPTGNDFSEATYAWQYRTSIQPGSKETFRSTQNPVDAAKKNQATKGWVQFNQLNDAIDVELTNRAAQGGSELLSKNPDLKAIKDAVVTKMAQTNTAWYDDYLDTDGSKTNRVIRGLGTIINNEKFMSVNKDNPTWKSVALYLQAREQLAQVLAARNSGGINNQANADVNAVYEAIVTKLKQDDINFSIMYDRFLSQDNVYDKRLVGVK
jgi:hypothetical protein